MNAYQALASRTIDRSLTEEQMEKHALFGMASEVGELHGIYQKSYQGHLIDDVHVQKELGDLLWFVAEICTANGWTLETIARMNIEKLKARYPDGFSAERSLHRKVGDI